MQYSIDTSLVAKCRHHPCFSKLILVGDRLFNSRYRRLVTRPRLAVVFAMLAISIASLVTLSWFQRSAVNEARFTVASLHQISVLAREINTLTWTALQEESLTPEVEAGIRAARQELPKAVLAAHLHSDPASAMQKLWPALDTYLVSADRQWILMQTGDLDNAKQADFRSVSPQFDLMQHELDVAIEAEDQWAQDEMLKSRNEILAAAVLTATAILILFLQFQRQEHVDQLEVVEREALRESEERFRALTEQSADIILITDAVGEIHYASPSVHAVLEVVAESFIGTKLSDQVHPQDISKVVQLGLKAVDSIRNPLISFRLRHADGRWLHFECSVRDLTEHRHIGGIVFNAREITERKHAEEELFFNATHDGLTGLPNRALLIARLQTILEGAKRNPREVAAVLFLDIDDFKVVNDCYGHAKGDLLIKEVGKRIKKCMRCDGLLARIGGDEFAVLVENVCDATDATRVAQRIQSSFEQPFQIDGLEVFKSTSIGIALTSAKTSPEEVLQNADIAMYRAKDQGKARIEVFDRTMHQQVMTRLLLEAKLRSALQNEELSLYYQPIVALETGAVQGFEALLRWGPDDAHSIPPSTFIPVAEQCGLIVPISEWALRKACLEAAGWGQLYPAEPPLYVSINISSKHFSYANLIGHVREALKESALDPKCLTIELTESVAMKDATATVDTMAQLRALGVNLSVDDFGTGYSSLSYLRRLPVDTLKIDQSFVATMDAENYAIVRTIIGLAFNLGLKVVAEGVETTNQHQLLALAGCGSAQGYLFAKPMPASSVKDFLEASWRQVVPMKRKALAQSTGGV